MSVEGTWDLTIATPAGLMTSVVELRREGGQLAGVGYEAGKEADGSVALTDITFDDKGGRLTWNQAITKPMRLKIAFAVTVDGDVLAGTSKAGFMPAAKVTGQRRAVTASTQ
jgi:hypothetical protein